MCVYTVSHNMMNIQRREIEIVFSTNKRSREQSSDSEDDFEVILNMPGEKVRKVEEGDTSEETLPDSNLRQERDGNEEPQVPKLLIKFAGPNNTSPTVNTVQHGRM